MGAGRRRTRPWGPPFWEGRSPFARGLALKELAASLPLPGVCLESRHQGKLCRLRNRGFESFKWLLVRYYTDSFNLPKELSSSGLLLTQHLAPAQAAAVPPIASPAPRPPPSSGLGPLPDSLAHPFSGGGWKGKRLVAGRAGFRTVQSPPLPDRVPRGGEQGVMLRPPAPQTHPRRAPGAPQLRDLRGGATGRGGLTRAFVLGTTTY